LVLDVLTINHRAQALYQRLGMTEIGRHGDGDGGDGDGDGDDHNAVRRSSRQARRHVIHRS
jgi:RimJ/RimL family protein N-acetyltransferase